MEPVFAALTAYIFSHEVLSLRQLAGCILILAGMLAAEFKGEEKTGAEQKAAEARP
jgi:drug/metabolite transporter (DMT)-like permease